MLKMKKSKNVKDYISRAMDIVHVSAIEEAKDLSKLIVELLCGSLQAYESRFSRPDEKPDGATL